MTISETEKYDIGEIALWVKERQKYHEQQSLELWRIMRVQTTIIANMMSSKTVKETDLFYLGDERPPKRTSEQLERIEQVFKKWDSDEQKHRNG